MNLTNSFFFIEKKKKKKDKRWEPFEDMMKKNLNV